MCASVIYRGRGGIKQKGKMDKNKWIRISG